MPPRPRVVAIAVVCLSISFAMGIASWFFTARWDLPSAWVIFFAISGLLCLNVVALYQGRNWVRWLNLVLIAVGLLSVHSLFAMPSITGVQWRFIAQALLQAITLVCLLLPASGQWYSQMTEVRRARKRATTLT